MCCISLYARIYITTLWYIGDVTVWKHFLHYWPFVRGMRWSPVHSRHKDPVTRPLIFFWNVTYRNCWINSRVPVVCRRHEVNDVIDLVHGRGLAWFAAVAGPFFPHNRASQSWDATCIPFKMATGTTYLWFFIQLRHITGANFYGASALPHLQP